MQLLCTRSLKTKSMAKYKNIKYKGYDSKKEYYRAQELKLLEENKVISGLKEQIRYELIPSQRDDKGKVVERSVCYVADFEYLRDGVVITEDTKGMKTKEYIIKRKLMLYMYGIKINEV